MAERVPPHTALAEHAAAHCLAVAALDNPDIAALPSRDPQPVMKAIAVRFDQPVFAAIDGLAAANAVSFAEQVRRLCAVGLQREQTSRDKAAPVDGGAQ